MAGVLFIVTVPRKELEEVLRKAEKSANLVVETEKDFPEQNNGLKYPVESYQTIDNALLAKCKSTDCLHEKAIGNSLFKSRSEIVLSDVEGSSLGSDYKSCLKSSWSDLKQVIRPRRNKLKISTPQKGLDVLAAFHFETPLEIIVTEVLKRLEIKNAAWTSTRNKEFWQVIFSLESSTVCEETLQVLRTLGVGSRHQSSMSVIPCNLYFRSSSEVNDEGSEVQSVRFLADNNTAWSRFTSSVRARTNLAQVLHDVRADAALTFDWLFLLIVAAFVSAIGLVENSTVILVASMLISPLMGPITAGTLGTAVKDCSLQHLGVLNELLGLLLSLVIGFIFGMAICAVDERYGIGDWPTNEMMSRCEIRSLWIGVLVAIPSGAGVALAVLGDNTASLVGVAISASLLPPAVNAGLLWAMSLVHLIFLDDETRWTGVITSCTYSKNPAVELAVLGTISLCLTLVNIVCIFVAGVAIYKVKEVSPLERRDISWWKANRGLLEASKLNKHENEGSQMEPPANWNKIFQSWCTMPDERKFENEKLPDPELQSDTITFRRQRPPNAKPTAPNVEAYLHRNIANFGKSRRPSTASDANTNNNQKEKEYNKKDLDSTYVEGDKVDYSGKFDFHNLGYQEDFTDEFDDDVEGKVVPTIEPSSNCTVDVKPVGLYLASKSFHV